MAVPPDPRFLGWLTRCALGDSDTPEIRPTAPARGIEHGEHLRLTAGTGRLEFLRTWDVLARVLPPAPARIVDVGGATGVYARPLAAPAPCPG